MCISECSYKFKQPSFIYIGFAQAAEGLDEGFDVDLYFPFERINIEENPFLFVTTPATNIPWILHVYFGGVHDVPQRCKLFSLEVLTIRV